MTRARLINDLRVAINDELLKKLLNETPEIQRLWVKQWPKEVLVEFIVSKVLREFGLWRFRQ
jgi:hypothetical protein